MRYTNTITLRIHSKSSQEQEVLKKYLYERYGKRVDIEEEVLSQEGFDDIFVMTAKLYHQPPQKRFLEDLKHRTFNLDALRREAALHLDAHQSFCFRLEKETFLSERWEFVHTGDVIQVKINVCAHPKNEQTALDAITEMLA